jgi:uncharacterized protein YjbI with pentapeptide repeats
MAQQSTSLPQEQPELQPLTRRLPRWMASSVLSSPMVVTAALMFLTFGLGVIVAGYLFTIDARSLRTFIHEIYSNFGAEFVGIGLTVLIIDSLNRRRADRERKEELISQMGSPDNAFALEAARILRQKGWLMDGSLHDASLWRANLQGAYLAQANLQRVVLERADLRGVELVSGDLRRADLSYANFQGADLQSANLRDAVLERADLRGADLETGNLQRANLKYANLQGADLKSTNLREALLERADLRGAELGSANLEQANLEGANLQGADLTSANLLGAVNVDHALFDAQTILPDGHPWSIARDLRQFIDPGHWRSQRTTQFNALRRKGDGWEES